MFEAHIKYSEAGAKIVQTVEEHSESVVKKAVIYSSTLKLEKTAELIGILHDVGKLTADFSRYINEDSEFNRGDIDHSYAGAKYIEEKLKGSIGEKLNIRHEEIASAVMGHVIAAHHGLKDWVSFDGTEKYKMRITKSERFNEIDENMAKTYSNEKLNTIYGQAVSEIESYVDRIVLFCNKYHGNNKKKNVSASFYIGLLERLLESILVDADRTDTIEFLKGTSIQFNRDSFGWNSIIERLELILKSFPNSSDVITLLRQDISDRCLKFSDHEVGICKLIVPTGGGKTLASMRFAVNYCQKYRKDRIFYIAPFMSILEQNSSVIRSIVGEENFLEHHSNVIIGKEENERLSEYELRADQWDSPVIATTVVQFLNSIFSAQMNSVRRFHQLANAVIIVDEAQSIPDRCIHLFNLAMNFLAHFCKASVVLCTATQPTLGNVSYPIVFDDSPYESMTGENYRDDFEKMKRNQIMLMDKMVSFSNSDAADFCLERFRTEGSVLFIVNTKKTASGIFKLIREKISPSEANVVHISTSMCPAHRKEKIQEVRDFLKSKKPVICVTTQLIEAGVDISFPCVIRSWAGLDNAAQAAGRCNRNGEISNLCKVYIIRLNEEELGSLSEIKTAQIAMDKTVFLYSKDELLQTDAIEQYFREYYLERENILSYPIEKYHSSILDLLSTNLVSTEQLSKNTYTYNSQAFKTAGSMFKVIDESAFDIIVPFNEKAEEVIARFYSWSESGDVKGLLKDSQQFIVSIYEQNRLKLLKNGGLDQVSIGNSENFVLILRPGFYNDDFGMNPDGECDIGFKFFM